MQDIYQGCGAIILLALAPTLAFFFFLSNLGTLTLRLFLSQTT